MKKTAKKHILCLVPVLALLVISCNDSFFDRESKAITSYTSIDEIETAIFSPYQQFVQGSTESPYFMTNFLHFGMSDIVREIASNGLDDVYDRSTSSQVSSVYKLFSPCYEIISNCNYLIEFIEGNPFGDQISESDRINNQNRIMGEAYFLRAHSYLQLAILFCPAYDPSGTNDSKRIPLRTKFASTMDIAMDVEPDETYKIYDQIVNDLLLATELLPKQYSSEMNTSYQFGRVTKHAAMAVLSKVYMLMGRYEDALALLDLVLDDSEVPRSLNEDPLDCFTNNASSTAWNDPEIIWYGYFADVSLPSTVSYRNINDGWAWFITYVFPLVNTYQEYFIWALNKSTLKKVGIIEEDESETDEWKADKRNVLFRRFDGYTRKTLQKGSSTLSSSAYEGYVGENDVLYISNKYFLVPDSANYTDPFQNLPMIRSAELYLMRAGIKTFLGLGGQATDLNTVRRRSWDESIGGSYPELTDADVTWDVVDNEWVKEMAFESDRVLWLQCFHKPIGPGDRDAPDLESPYDNFYWPVYQSELDYQ